MWNTEAEVLVPTELLKSEFLVPSDRSSSCAARRSPSPPCPPTEARNGGLRNAARGKRKGREERKVHGPGMAASSARIISDYNRSTLRLVLVRHYLQHQHLPAPHQFASLAQHYLCAVSQFHRLRRHSRSHSRVRHYSHTLRLSIQVNHDTDEPHRWCRRKAAEHAEDGTSFWRRGIDTPCWWFLELRQQPGAQHRVHCGSRDH